MSAHRSHGGIALTLGATVILAAALAVGLAGGTSGAATGPVADAAAPDRRPNVVFVLSDDQPDSTFRPAMMPRTFKALGDAVNFEDAIAAPPLCCPYRAGVVGGQYPQNHGVEMSHPGYASLNNKRLVLPEFLRQAGYTTAFVGKYLNGTAAAIGTTPAPGWDRWAAFADKPSYRGPELSLDGRTRSWGEDRLTSKVLTRQAERFVNRQRGESEPFFLWLAHYAPHPLRGSKGSCGGNHAAPSRARDYRFAGRFDFPRGPNFNHNPSGKPPWLREVADRLNRAERREIRNRWRCSLGATQEVDRSIAALVKRLKRNGQLKNTMFVFGSDNGTNFGEHQLQRKKGIYEEKLQVPLMIQAPQRPAFRRTAGTDRPELVSEVDLMATIMDLADAEPCVDDRCRRLDGRSLLPLLRNPASPEWTEDRGIPIKTGSCWIRAYRTTTEAFINSEPAARKNNKRRCTWPPRGYTELYRVDKDPDQLDNRARRLSGADLAPYTERLDSLQRCTGIAGREPELEDRPFCE